MNMSSRDSCSTQVPLCLCFGNAIEMNDFRSRGYDEDRGSTSEMIMATMLDNITTGSALHGFFCNMNNAQATPTTPDVITTLAIVLMLLPYTYCTFVSCRRGSCCASETGIGTATIWTHAH